MVTKGLAADRDGPAPTRIYAIGDVHGHVDLLRAMHDAVRRDLAANPAPALLVHLGDYIDRGPDSAGCIDLLAAGPPISGLPTVNLMGNHEHMMLDVLDRPSQAPLWLRNGGDRSLASWGIAPDSDPAGWRERIPEHHHRFLDDLALHEAVGGYVFVHAGVRPGVRLETQDPHDMLWIREGFLDWDGVMLPETPEWLIVHGHTPAEAPDVRGNRIGIDTNAARGGKLTCAVLARHSVYFLQV